MILTMHAATRETPAEYGYSGPCFCSHAGCDWYGDRDAHQGDYVMQNGYVYCLDHIPSCVCCEKPVTDNQHWDTHQSSLGSGFIHEHCKEAMAQAVAEEEKYAE